MTTIEDAMFHYREGRINFIDYYSAVARSVAVDNVDELLAILSMPHRRRFVEWATDRRLSVTNPDPSPEEVLRVHNAVRAWLEQHGEYKDAVDSSFAFE